MVNRLKRSVSFFGIVNLLIMAVVIFVTLFPILHVVALSLSHPNAVLRDEVVLIPQQPSFLGYQLLSRSQSIGRAYVNTIVYTVANVIGAVFIASITSYPLSMRGLPGRSLVTKLVTLPMFFSGGIIPLFLVVRGLGLYNTMWAFVLPAWFVPFFIILHRTSFQNLPDSLRESALIDGANDVVIWARIAVPLSKPIMATIALFSGVLMWNAFFQPYIFLDDQTKFPLQIILRKLLLEGSATEVGVISAGFDEALNQEGITELLKYTATVVTIGPIVLVYPFLQKYFTKGALVGSVKE